MSQTQLRVRGRTHSSTTVVDNATITKSWRPSDGLLESCDRESLDDLPRWPRLNHDHLTEDFALACLRGGLHARLDAAGAGNCEDPRTLHLFRSQLCQCLQHTR